MIDVSRIEKSVGSNPRFVEKLFTDVEIKYCEAKNAGRYQSYAARFAAKEAFLKALGAGMFAGAKLTEIEVVNDAESGAPTLKLHGGAAEMYRLKGGRDLSVSLTHTSAIAFAAVVILGE